MQALHRQLTMFGTKPVGLKGTRDPSKGTEGGSKRNDAMAVGEELCLDDLDAVAGGRGAGSSPTQHHPNHQNDPHRNASTQANLDEVSRRLGKMGQRKIDHKNEKRFGGGEHTGKKKK